MHGCAQRPAAGGGSDRRGGQAHGVRDPADRYRRRGRRRGRGRRRRGGRGGGRRRAAGGRRCLLRPPGPVRDGGPAGERGRAPRALPPGAGAEQGRPPPGAAPLPVTCRAAELVHRRPPSPRRRDLLHQGTAGLTRPGRAARGARPRARAHLRPGHPARHVLGGAGHRHHVPGRPGPVPARPGRDRRACDGSGLEVPRPRRQRAQVPRTRRQRAQAPRMRRQRAQALRPRVAVRTASACWRGPRCCCSGPSRRW